MIPQLPRFASTIRALLLLQAVNPPELTGRLPILVPPFLPIFVPRLVSLLPWALNIVLHTGFASYQTTGWVDVSFASFFLTTPLAFVERAFVSAFLAYRLPLFVPFGTRRVPPAPKSPLFLSVRKQ